MDSNSAAAKSPPKKKYIGKVLPYILIGIGLVIPLLGKIIILGPLLVSFAPDFLLIGVALIIERHLILSEKSGIRFAAFLLVCVVLGLNTRIPSIIYDVLIGRSHENLAGKLQLSVGDSIHLDSNVKELSARKFSYSGSYPQCNEGFCAVIIGYYPPATYLGIDYWKEIPAQSIKSFGYSLATSDQKAPTLKIRANKEGHVLKVNLELLDDTGNLVSSENRVYRNGFPLESKDLDGNESEGQQLVWILEYLLHGNMVSKFVARRFGYSQASPAGYFLNSSIQRYVQQDDPKFTQLLVPVVEKTVEINSEVSDKVWNDIFFDKERSDACKTFVQQEITNIDTPDFTVGSGIKNMGKARRPLKFLHGKNGNERILVHSIATNEVLCEGDYLYHIARTHNYTQYEISKYRYDGTFIYRVAFKKPKSPQGLVGTISPTSLKEINGVLKFDYVDFVNNNRWDRRINRIRSMRLTPQQTE